MVPSPLSLQDAIHWVDSESKDPDPLTRLQTASVLVQDLAEVGDAALGYFVDQARHGGHSWSEIGVALGVSKQAAQQKHTVRLSLGPNAPTFEHLTPRARRVVSEAERIARSWKHGYVGTEHVLLALYGEPEGIAAQVLVDLKFPQKKAESAVAGGVEPGTGGPEGAEQSDGDLIFTPRVIAAFSSALSSALELGHNYIGTEHLLMGLVRGNGVAADVLEDAGLTQDVLAEEVARKLADYVERGRALKSPRKRTAVTPSSVAPRAASTRGAKKARATKKKASRT